MTDHIDKASVDYRSYCDATLPIFGPEWGVQALRVQFPFR